MDADCVVVLHEMPERESLSIVLIWMHVAFGS